MGSQLKKFLIKEKTKFKFEQFQTIDGCSNGVLRNPEVGAKYSNVS